jgi:hypothetical protein
LSFQLKLKFICQVLQSSTYNLQVYYDFIKTNHHTSKSIAFCSSFETLNTLCILRRKKLTNNFQKLHLKCSFHFNPMTHHMTHQVCSFNFKLKILSQMSHHTTIYIQLLELELSFELILHNF